MLGHKWSSRANGPPDKERQILVIPIPHRPREAEGVPDEMNRECPREDGVVTAPMYLKEAVPFQISLNPQAGGVADRQEVHDQRGNEAPDTGLLALDYLDWDIRH